MNHLISKEHLIEFLSEELGSNYSIFQRLFGHFTNHLLELRKSSDNLSAQGPIAHKAKTGCVSFGAHELYKMLEELELKCKSKELDAQKKLFISIDQLIDPNLKEINSIAEEFFKGVLKGA